jgi:hypothetical protein
MPKLRTLKFDEYTGELTDISFTYPASVENLKSQDNYEKYVRFTSMNTEEIIILIMTLSKILKDVEKNADKKETI